MKKLYKCKSEAAIFGVCAGLAKYFGTDVTLIRILWVLISVFTTGIPGTVVYLICALVMPDEPDTYDPEQFNYDND